MIKTSLFLALVALTLTSVCAIEHPVKIKAYRKCPCKCFYGYKARVAVRQCRRSIFSYQCQVEKCRVPHTYRKGKWCCDKPKPSLKPSVVPSTTPSATPSTTPPVTPSTSPSVTPSTSAIPSKSAAPSKLPCPCYCVKKYVARRQCRYKPYCQVIKCPPEEHHGKRTYGYYNKPEFQCCYKKYPHHDHE